jgi:hypothetical protein
MQHQAQDFMAGRIHPALFDTELPPDARSDLVRPKQRAILHRPVYEPDRSGILKLAGSVLVVAILLVGVLTNRQQNLAAPKQQSAPVAQPTPAPSMQPVPCSVNKMSAAPVSFIRRLAAPQTLATAKNR